MNLPRVVMPAAVAARTSEQTFALCNTLVPGGLPVRLAVEPVPGAEVNECFPAVERQVLRLGGTLCVGWQLWERPDVLVEAEFHGVWRAPSGSLHDITPKDPPVEEILFLEDPTRRYEGRQVQNVRLALSRSAPLQHYFSACEREFELLNRGSRADMHGRVVLTGTEVDEHEAIRLAKVRSLIAHFYPGQQPNMPCWCGSGKKLKKCHAG